MRILIAVVDPVEHLTLETLLREWGHDVVAAANADEVCQILNTRNAPGLALVQWDLPGMDGPLLCRKLRNRPEAAYVYLILVGQPGERDPLAAFEAGADDFLPSALDQATLKLRLRTAEHILSLQRNLVQSRQALEYKSTHDALTGVWNRAEVLGLLDREISRACREGSTVSLLMIDVDHFKQVNDTLGHLGGDAALREITARLVSFIRPYDAIGRYGGEEFLVVLSGCSPANAARLAERLRERVGATPAILELEHPVTISIGVATWTNEYGDVQALIRAADAALYRAKNCGRDRVEVAWDDTRRARALREGDAA
ncbi:MAG: diguanylate cyclase [Armatimonadota bacterium]